MALLTLSQPRQACDGAEYLNASRTPSISIPVGQTCLPTPDETLGLMPILYDIISATQQNTVHAHIPR